MWYLLTFEKQGDKLIKSQELLISISPRCGPSGVARMPNSSACLGQSMTERPNCWRVTFITTRTGQFDYFVDFFATKAHA